MQPDGESPPGKGKLVRCRPSLLQGTAAHCVCNCIVCLCAGDGIFLFVWFLRFYIGVNYFISSSVSRMISGAIRSRSFLTIRLYKG